MQKKHLKTTIFGSLIILSILSCIFWYEKYIKVDRIYLPLTGSSTPSPNPETEQNKIKQSTKETYVSIIPTQTTTNPLSSGYPFTLPIDSPFSIEEIEGLYQRANERYYSSYKPDLNVNSEEDFKRIIDPYFKLFIASNQYSFEKYDAIFRGNNPRLADRTNLFITANQKCTDIGTGLTEEVCSDVKIIGTINPFTFRTNFYANLSHPDFSVDLLIDTGTHETIHLLQYTFEKGFSTGMPDWFKESMAVGLAYSSKNKIELYKKDYEKYGYPADLKQMEEYLNFSHDDLEKLAKKRAAYYVSDLFWKFLMQKVSLEDYLDLIPLAHTYRENDNNTEFEKRFIELTGYNSKQIYQNFLETL